MSVHLEAGSASPNCQGAPTLTGFHLLAVGACAANQVDGQDELLLDAAQPGSASELARLITQAYEDADDHLRYAVRDSFQAEMSGSVPHVNPSQRPRTVTPPAPDDDNCR